MQSPLLVSESGPRLANRLAAISQERFVGRLAERETFHSALLARVPRFNVLYVYGAGGAGKTNQLREYERLAADAGFPAEGTAEYQAFNQEVVAEFRANGGQDCVFRITAGGADSNFGNPA
jgi:hypothetical protein